MNTWLTALPPNMLDAVAYRKVGWEPSALTPREYADKVYAEGKLYAFNGRWHGRPAILAHVYGTKPVPTSVEGVSW